MCMRMSVFIPCIWRVVFTLSPYTFFEHKIYFLHTWLPSLIYPVMSVLYSWVWSVESWVLIGHICVSFMNHILFMSFMSQHLIMSFICYTLIASKTWSDWISLPCVCANVLISTDSWLFLTLSVGSLSGCWQIIRVGFLWAFSWIGIYSPVYCLYTYGRLAPNSFFCSPSGFRFQGPNMMAGCSL